MYHSSKQVITGNHGTLIRRIQLALVLIGIGLIGLGAVLLFIFAKDVALLWKGEYKETTCTVISVDKLGKQNCDHLDRKKKVLLDCLKVNVDFSVSKWEEPQTGMLYNNEHTFEDHNQCSFYTCNVKQPQVLAFENEYGQIGEKFTCFYDSQNKTIVIANWVSRISVIHKIAWPSLVVVIGSCFLSLACCFKELPCIRKAIQDAEHHVKSADGNECGELLSKNQSSPKKNNRERKKSNDLSTLDPENKKEFSNANGSDQKLNHKKQIKNDISMLGNGAHESEPKKPKKKSKQKKVNQEKESINTDS